MNATANASITKTQLFFLIVKTQIGIGLLSLPSDIQHSAKGDSWLSVLLAGAVIQLLLLIYWRLLKKFQGANLSQIIVSLLGRYAGKALNLIYYVFFILIAAYASTLYVQLIRTWMLALTPGWMLFLLIIGTSLYLACDNLRVIARFFVLASMLFIVLVLISFLTFSHETHLAYVLPLGQSGISPILEGSERTFFSMLGFEVSLYFVAQVQGERSGGIGVMSLSNVFVTIFYTYFVFICQIGLSPGALTQVNEPVLYILKGLSYQLFDRIDLIFLTIWIIPMTATLVCYLAIAGKSLTVKQPSYRKLVVFSAITVFACGWILSAQENLDVFSKWLEYSYLIMIAAVPLLLLLTSFLVKPNKKVEAT
ncbi:spore germination protein (amino acid permease) [Paenibacillus taihuensis]|uniref:Spore germination protein (Amino acid permease) n=1 Tax=Paenibacillus taihuensis TaxID=1156355 RepID=A0A3D9R433_9BACL|nr:GerAB/ArcD/ProY family transporter [Paenibacillus taihuensis]REE70540.1 spore germination protein (amino acid permease) [Paenibacillus taihuensis]